MTDNKQTRWERLEDWLYNRGPAVEFTAAEYAQATGIETPDASRDIQYYLAAQRRRWYYAEGSDGKPERRGGSNTLYVLHRVPGTRTASARWVAGVSVKDVRAVGTGFHDDVLRRVMRAFRPDLLRIADRNPRAAKQAEARIESVIEGAMRVLEAAVRDAMPDDDEQGS